MFKNDSHDINDKIRKKNIQVHFIGVGGIGMSGLAEVLLQLGHKVSGSDLVENQNTLKLRRLGADIKIGHHAANIVGATVVVYSSAVKKDNPEFLEAKQKAIPLIRRAEMLAELMRLKYGIAVAGTHGKTTTTSFLATIFHEAEMDATHIIGGIVENLGGHARVGKGDILIAESDESDGSFLLLGPIMSVITNIDDDHLDYHKTKKRLIDSFLCFANKVPFYGCCALNIHDEELRKLRRRIKRPWVTFGILDDSVTSLPSVATDKKSQPSNIKADCQEVPNYQARKISYENGNTYYDLYFNGEMVSKIKILLPGRHNVLNSLGAIAISHQFGLTFDQVAKGVEKFRGVGRRLEMLYQGNGLEIIDDYAHHPTEIINTLQTLRILKREGKIIAVFEPHRYTRTKICWDKFLHCFNEVDELYILPIYAASEPPIDGINSSKLVNDINKIHPLMAHFADKFETIKEIIEKNLRSNTEITVITLGAGSIGKNIRELVSNLKNQAKCSNQK